MAEKLSTNPNQKHVYINKQMCNGHKEENYYCVINLRSLQYAIQNLSQAEFQVWLYLAKNKDGHDTWFSPAAAAAEWGLKPSTVRNAMRKLEADGYLVKRMRVSENGDYELYQAVYDFYEIPPQDLEPVLVHKVEQQPVNNVVSFSIPSPKY